jgi:hypothetical protein
LHNCDQIPDRNNLREEGIILAHSFRGFKFMVAYLHALEQNIMVVGAHGMLCPLVMDSKQRRQKRYLKGPFFNDLLPPARSHLLKVSRTFQNSTPNRGPSPQHMNLFGGYFISKP